MKTEERILLTCFALLQAVRPVVETLGPLLLAQTEANFMSKQFLNPSQRTYSNKILLGPAMLSGFVCVPLPAVPGSNPKYTIYAFIVKCFHCVEKRTKRGRVWLTLKNNIYIRIKEQIRRLE